MVDQELPQAIVGRSIALDLDEEGNDDWRSLLSRSLMNDVLTNRPLDLLTDAAFGPPGLGAELR